ncbi:response regulator [candidate division WS5 bacterium]|uniref:Response regulator n=1 Tax=candidate division WS5 bacterium TaxID=2093353 RepID=A0A419DCC3_9BACT|nr:MAG: response regulator [candidate division WS5 bacterium]
MAKVLIIEDEKAMSDLVAIKFRVEGFEVEQGFSFNEAKEKLVSAWPFDAILTDYLLPDGDLTEFLTVLRKDPKTEQIPVVVMTNYVEDLNQEQLKALGVNEVIVKYQVVPAQMVEKIRMLLGGVPVQPASPAV